MRGVDALVDIAFVDITSGLGGCDAHYVRLGVGDAGELRCLADFVAEGGGGVTCHGQW